MSERAMHSANLWIKICANTSAEDALLAAGAGADAVGFVFAPSSRRVTVEQVAAIVPALPLELEKIGVFVDAAFDEVAAAVVACGLTGVQLHFDAAPELTAELRVRFGAGLRIVRTVHFAESAPELPPHVHRDANIDAVLVDSCTAKARGGTGIAFDWRLAAATVFKNAGARSAIAAGGLTPDNVAQAIATLRPWGVDVASGVEAAPGRKDAAKLRTFVTNARAARRG